MTIMVFGRDGQLGWELQRPLRCLGAVLALGREEADFTREEKLRHVIRTHRPSIIVNAAAYTAVDQAEAEFSLAHQINALAVKVIAEEAAALNAWVVHYSTDYVFDGLKHNSYNETDIANPLSVYGKTKLAGEQAIIEAGGRYLIFRCSWLYSSRRINFPLSILRMALERDRFKVVDDCFGAPTGVPLVADVTALALRRLLDGSRDEDVSGIYHLAAGGETTWHNYARLLVAGAERLGISVRVDPANIESISQDDYGSPAPRPTNSRFDTTKIRDTLDIELPDWQVGIDRFLHQIADPLRMFPAIE
jgi:dTDP-4-dehydrorhamnose reductase